MANRRRGGPPDLKGTLGTLIRTTLSQMAGLRDAVERQARQQRGWFDTAMLARERQQVLASLGEVVYELAISGEFGNLEDFPEVAQLISDLEQVDGQIAQGESGQSQPSSRDPDMRVWRPVMPEDDDTQTTEPAEAKAEAQSPRRRRAARGAGGIQFVQDSSDCVDPDDDLSEYMHEDDVPSADTESQDD